MKMLTRITLLLFSLISLSWGTTAYASCDEPPYSAFDFWLGEWVVTNPKGQLAGTNTIEKRYDGCVITEHWANQQGPYGTSLNIYDRSTQQWYQTWVDKSGLRLQLSGNIEEGAMVMRGITLSSNGEQMEHKISWTPQQNGSVIQHWQARKPSDDEWRTLFKGIYTRK